METIQTSLNYQMRENPSEMKVKSALKIIISLYFIGSIFFCGCQTTSPQAHDCMSHCIPGSSESAEPYLVNEPGRYVLAGNRHCKETGIIIHADHVTLDLMGHELVGPGRDSGENYGILTNNYRNLEVRNGTIRDFGDRGIVDRGKEQPTGYKRILNIRSISNGKCGICIGGPANLVMDCTCVGNGASGICPGYRSRVTGNLCHGNEHIGIHAGRGCLITDNVASENGQTGIVAFCGSTVVGNTVYMNNLINDPNHAGIRVENGCLAKNNTLRGNKQNGFLVRGTGNEIKENCTSDAEQ